jgi:hypothetical protein
VPLVRSAADVNVAPAGAPLAVKDAMASPSESEAVTVTVIGVPSLPETDAGAVTVGA